MDPSLKTIYNRLTNQFFRFTLWILPFMTIVLVLRYMSMGWLDVFYIYFSFGFVALLLYSLRNRLSYIAKVHLVASLLLLTGFGGMYYLALSGGYYFAVVTLILVSLIRGYKTGIIYALVFFTGFAIYALLFTKEILQTDMQLAAYNQNIYSWLANGLALLWLIILAIYSASKFKSLFDLTLKEMRKRQNQAIEVKNNSIRQLDSLPIAVLILKNKQERPYANNAFTQLFGSLSETNQKNFMEQVSDNQSWEVAVETCKQSPGTSKVINMELTSCSDQAVFVTAHITSTASEVEVCFVDNTSKVKSSKRFGELEKRFAVLLNNISEGVLILDDTGMVVLHNASFRDLSMYTDDEILGKTISFFIERSASNNNGESAESAIRQKNGTMCPIEVTFNPFFFYQKEYRLLFVRDIRLRKKTESELIENRNKYKQLFEHLTASYALHEIILDANGNPVDYRFLEVNRAFEEMTGLVRSQILGKTVKEIIPQIEQEWIDKYGSVAITGKPIQFESYSAGLGRHYQVSAFSPTRHKFAVVFNDVTLVKKAEERIHETQKMYTDLVEEAQSVIWKLDCEGKYTYINSACERTFGFTKEEMLGHVFTEFLPAEFSEKEFSAFKSQFKELVHLKEHETFHRTKNGKTMLVSVNSKPIVDENGKLTGFHGTTNDISLRYLAEQTVKESEHRFHLAMTGAEVGLWDWNIAEDTLYYSPMWKQILGYEDDELEDSFEQWSRLLVPEEKEQRKAYVLDFLKSGKTKYESEFKMIHKSGKLIDILARGYLIRDEHNNPIRFTGTHVDITEKKRIEHELTMHKAQLEETVKKRTEDLASAITMLQQSNRYLEEKKEKLSETLDNLHKTQDQLIHSEKMASLGILIAGIAHEINNPINYISANLQGMDAFASLLPELIEQYNAITPSNVADTLPQIEQFKNETDFSFKSENFASSIAAIKTGTERIAAIVKSLRTVSGSSSSQKTKTDIKECIDTSLSLLSHELKYGITVTNLIDSDIPPVWANSNRLSQVFINILMNSADAMEKQGQITIKNKFSETKDVVVINIEDSGPGIPDEHLPHIFEPFYTTKPVGYGTGLGLYICYQIIFELGGSLMVGKSELGGACFYISLPVYSDDKTKNKKDIPRS